MSKPELQYRTKVKTIKQWFSKVKDNEIKDALLRNLSDSQANKPAATLIDALEEGFLWNKTEEGFRFWRKVCDAAKEGKL